MTDRLRPDEAVSRLAELSREVDELEVVRFALIERVERLRGQLQSAGRRTTAAYASIDMLREHVSATMAAAGEMRAIEQEIRELGVATVAMDDEAIGLLFEADSLQKTLTEAEDEMERLLSILIEGKQKQPRGH
jgi:uncharacterized coiled-coil DUF342 family protein